MDIEASAYLEMRVAQTKRNAIPIFLVHSLAGAWFLYTSLCLKGGRRGIGSVDDTKPRTGFLLDPCRNQLE
jgi:hypothetical protein